MKNVPVKSKITTAHLQISELCALVETLPYWTVADKVKKFGVTVTYSLISCPLCSI